MKSPLTRQQFFIKALAKYLAENQVHKSIEIQMGLPHAKEWQTLRCASPLFGYPTVKEAEKELTQFLKGL